MTFHLSQALALDNLGFLCLSAFTKVFKVNYKASRGKKDKKLSIANEDSFKPRLGKREVHSKEL